MHQTDFSLDSTMPFSRTKTISILSVVAILLIASMLLVTHFSPGSEANVRSQLLRLGPADATAVIFIVLDEFRGSPCLAQLHSWGPLPAEDSEYPQLVPQTGF